jgi:hypothetical protein
MTTLGLERLAGRCSNGFDIATQHDLCDCPAGTQSEWATFLAAVRRAATETGDVSQTNVRPLIQSIPAKRRGQLYRRAVAERVLVDTGEREPSTDHAGRNSDKLQRRYRLGAAA